MIVLGISDMSQDSSACIIQDGQLIAAVSEERVSRLKHCGGYPGGAIGEVLALAGAQPKDIDAIAVGNTSAEALMRFSTHALGIRNVRERVPMNARGILSTGSFILYRILRENSPSISSVDRALSSGFLHRTLRRQGLVSQVEHLDHHLSHAASAFFTSGFRKSLVLTLDAYGDGRSGALFMGKGRELEELASFSPVVSLGEFYGAITALLGYQFGSDEGKTMALAAFGNPTILPRWKDRIKIDGLSLKGDLTRQRRFTFRALGSLVRAHKPEDIAASAQALLEETVCELVKNAVEQTGCRRLCLAGGVALNVKMNLRLLELPAVKDIHVFPAPADDGTAVGAALLLSASKGRVKNTRLASAALGSSYTPEDIESALSSHPRSRRFSVSPYDSDRTAKELARGRLVGWFQGRMEFGPRALGQRSLLADPRSAESPKRIRKSIKLRPEFQPFCPSISTSYARELLLNPKQVRTQFMTLAVRTKPEAAKEVPAVVHIDGTTRPQIVEKKRQKRYHELITAFGEESGVEGLLNTSLNRSSEAIVRSPRDALDLLLDTDLDILIMEGLSIRRSSP